MHGPLGQTTSVKCPTGELWTSPAFCSSICFKRLRASSSRSRPGRRACSKMATLSTAMCLSTARPQSSGGPRILWQGLHPPVTFENSNRIMKFAAPTASHSTTATVEVSKIHCFSWSDANHPCRERSCDSQSPAKQTATWFAPDLHGS